ncbi:MAG: glycine C-acetyltransferase, partial [Alishewanella sp. 34-51-39]
MRNGAFLHHLQQQIEEVKAEGLYKAERIISSQQQACVTVGSEQVLNFCANNYLGLANNPELIAAAQQGLQS